MDASIAVSSLSLTSLDPVTLLAPVANTSGSAVVLPSAAVATDSSIVALSTTGQLAAAAATFSDNLNTLLSTATTDNATPTTVLDTAQSLVDAFNQFQTSLGNLQATTATSATTTATTATRNLASIGITVQTTATQNPSLAINPTVLTSAASTQTNNTRALLAATAQSLLDQINNVAQNLVATTNTPALTLNLAGVAPAARTTANTAATVTPAVQPASDATAAQAATTTTTQNATATVATPATAATATTSADIASDTAANDLQAAIDRIALQNRIDNPLSRANDQFFDPNYAAIIAASHQVDFVAHLPTDNPKALAADVPGAVRPATPATAVTYSNEDAGGTERYRLLHATA